MAGRGLDGQEDAGSAAAGAGAECPRLADNRGSAGGDLGALQADDGLHIELQAVLADVQAVLAQEPDVVASRSGADNDLPARVGGRLSRHAGRGVHAAAQVFLLLATKVREGAAPAVNAVLAGPADDVEARRVGGAMDVEMETVLEMRVGRRVDLQADAARAQVNHDYGQPVAVGLDGRHERDWSSEVGSFLQGCHFSSSSPTAYYPPCGPELGLRVTQARGIPTV